LFEAKEVRLLVNGVLRSGARRAGRGRGVRVGGAGGERRGSGRGGRRAVAGARREDAATHHYHTATRAQIATPTSRRDRLGAAVVASTIASAIRRKSAPHEAQDAVSVNRSKPQFGQNFIVHLLENAPSNNAGELLLDRSRASRRVGGSTPHRTGAVAAMDATTGDLLTSTRFTRPDLGAELR